MTRNDSDKIKINELIKYNGKTIHFSRTNKTYNFNSSPDDFFMLDIEVAVAKKLSNDISRKTKMGSREKAEQGIYPSRAPIGYENVLINGKKVIAPHIDTAPIIKKIFELYASELYSLNELTQKVDTDCLLTNTSINKINKSHIYRILHNPIYYGVFKWSNKIYQGTHTPIIDKSTFDKVQSILEDKGPTSSKQRKHSWAFQGMVRCGECGCAFVAEKKKNKYVYYHCTWNRKCNNKKYVKEADLAFQFGQGLKLLQMDAEVISWLSGTLENSCAEEKQSRKTAITNLKKEASRLTNLINGSYADKLEGKITEKYFNQVSETWRTKLIDIEHSIKHHQKNNGNYIDTSSKLLELSQKAYDLYVTQNMEEKRKLLNFVYSNSTYLNGKLTPVFRQPFASIAFANFEFKKKKAVSQLKNDLSCVWYPQTKIIGKN